MLELHVGTNEVLLVDKLL